MIIDPDLEELSAGPDEEEDEDCHCVICDWLNATPSLWGEYAELMDGVVSRLDRLHVDEEHLQEGDEGRPRWTPPNPKPAKH